MTHIVERSVMRIFRRSERLSMSTPLTLRRVRRRRPPALVGRLLPLGAVLALTVLLGEGAARAADPPAAPPPHDEVRARIEELERKVAELQRLLAEARASGPGVAAERLAELERRLDVLAAEIEKLRSGNAAIETPSAPSRGLGPAASKVYARDKGVSIGGYGEALYQNPSSRADDGSPSGEENTFDLTRAVFYFGYKFEKGIVFNSEVEYEHATTGEGSEERGEVSVEFAYLDFPLGHGVGIRAGKLLTPVGLINELHEPPIYLGSVRPDVERFILPSTWSELGAGAYGEHGPISWRAYVQASLDASGFTAGGIREGRQEGSNSKARDLGLAARLDATPLPGLLIGGSVFTGDTGQGLQDASGRTIAARTRIFDLHADYKARGFQARALYAGGRVGDAARLDGALGLAGSASIGSRSAGWYAEAGYDVLRFASETEESSLVPFVRYERYAAQDEVPAGFMRDPSLRVRLLTGGVSYRPIPNIILKADYQDYRNDAKTGVDRFNLALGYIF